MSSQKTLPYTCRVSPIIMADLAVFLKRMGAEPRNASELLRFSMETLHNAVKDKLPHTHESLEAALNTLHHLNINSLERGKRRAFELVSREIESKVSIDAVLAEMEKVE